MKTPAVKKGAVKQDACTLHSSRNEIVMAWLVG